MKSRDTTEIRWNYELEVYECKKCHSIMYYDPRFKVCPFCDRLIIHRRYGWKDDDSWRSHGKR